MELRWYVALLVLESNILEEWSGSSVDIQFRLIRATDAEAAYQRALALGRESEQSYVNPYGQTCVWSFKGLKDLHEVICDELADGVEVYGFIEDSAALDHVVPKEQLTLFRTSDPVEDQPDSGIWNGEP